MQVNLFQQEYVKKPYYIIDKIIDLFNTIHMYHKYKHTL